MALAHYRLLHTSREGRPKLLFEVKLDIQDIRSGYDGSRHFVCLGDWLEDSNLQWTQDMVREISLDELQRIRADLRDRVLGSALCDGSKITGSIEQAYREMWRKWCGRRMPNVES